MNAPTCCGSVMRLSAGTGRFVEAKCGKCGDVVYVKNRADRPVLLDD